VDNITGLEDLGGELGILKEMVPMLKFLEKKLDAGRLLGGSLPASFEEKMATAIQERVSQGDDKGVLKVLETKAEMLLPSMSEAHKTHPVKPRTLIPVLDPVFNASPNLSFNPDLILILGQQVPDHRVTRRTAGSPCRFWL